MLDEEVRLEAMATMLVLAKTESWVPLSRKVLKWIRKMIRCYVVENPEGCCDSSMELDEVKVHTSVTNDQVKCQKYLVYRWEY